MLLRIWQSSDLCDKLFHLNSQLHLERWDVFHAPNGGKKSSIFLGFFSRVVHRSAISFCMLVINSRVMSISSFLYCRLLTRMTSCWLWNISFTFPWNKAVESASETLLSCFYIHIMWPISLLSVCVSGGPLSGEKLLAHSFTELYLKMKARQRHLFRTTVHFPSTPHG